MMGAAKAQYDGIVAFSQTDFTEDLKKITVPIVVIHGDDDQIVPYADSGLLSAELLQNATLKTCQGFPHGMPTTQAETINAWQDGVERDYLGGRAAQLMHGHFTGLGVDHARGYLRGVHVQSDQLRTFAMVGTPSVWCCRRPSRSSPSARLLIRTPGVWWVPAYLLRQPATDSSIRSEAKAHDQESGSRRSRELRSELPELELLGTAQVDAVGR